MRRFSQIALREILPPVCFFVVVVVLWDVAIRVFKVEPFLLPGPGRGLSAAVEKRHLLLGAMLLTGSEALCGFISSFVVGCLIAFVFSLSGMAKRCGYPYAIFLQTVPIVAIAPLIVIWFGSGFQSVVIASFIVSLFPIITNGATGLTTVDRNLVELFELNNASRWSTLTKLRLPNAVPYLVTGAKVSSGLSVIGAVVGDFFVGYGGDLFGLGYLINMTKDQLKTDLLVSAILASTLLGLIIFGLVSLIGAAILARRHVD